MALHDEISYVTAYIERYDEGYKQRQRLAMAKNLLNVLDDTKIADVFNVPLDEVVKLGNEIFLIVDKLI